VHCAAITDFGRAEALYQQVNVDGTRQVIELAREHATPLVHVGTAYVCGERSGTIAESELDVGQRLGNNYEESKLRAETLVRKANADGLPVAVVRPSIVVGAARTGVVRDFKNIYVVLKLTTQGRVRSIPGHFDAMLDLVPVDHVADVVAATVDRFAEAEGRTFHAVGGMHHSEVDLGIRLEFQTPKWLEIRLIFARNRHREMNISEMMMNRLHECICDHDHFAGVDRFDKVLGVEIAITKMNSEFDLLRNRRRYSLHPIHDILLRSTDCRIPIRQLPVQDDHLDADIPLDAEIVVRYCVANRLNLSNHRPFVGGLDRRQN